MTRFANVVFILLVLPICVSAATASASLSGGDTVEPGETLTLTFEVSGSNIYGVMGSLYYDSDQLTCTGIKPVTGSGWKADCNADRFLVYDGAMEAPVNSSTALFLVTFQVSSELAPGTDISVSCVDVVVSDGISDTPLNAVSWNGSVAEEQEATTTAPPTEPTNVPVYIPEESLRVTEPTETTVLPTTAPAPSQAAPVVSEEPSGDSGEPLWTYLVLGLAFLLVGIGSGILINQRFFQKQ